MEIIKKKISDLKENPINVRKHNNVQIKEFKKSIEKFDVIRPIVVDEKNVILAGHGLYSALKELGREEVDVIVMNGLSEKDKKKLLLVDNKIYSLGNDDYTAIDNILNELAKDSDFDVPGYDSSILEEMYGIKSVEKEVEQGAFKEVELGHEQMPTPTSEQLEEERKQIEKVIEPPARIQEQREEAEQRKFVICPSCGEKVWL